MIEAVAKQNFILMFFAWHFYETPKAILKAWFNVLYFTGRYFSFGFQLKTFFSHWRKYKDQYSAGFDIKQYSQTFVFNTISRILGAVLRTFIIVCGIIVETLVFIVGVLLLFFWLFLPFIILFAFVFAGYLLV